MKLPEQVTRLGIVIAVIVAVILLLRFVILPESLFSARPHQAAAVEREMAKPLRHAGVAACRECHEEQFELKYGGKHRNIGCENCHGPAASHAADENAAKPRLPREREFCLACHGYDSSRPNGFPQVDPLAAQAAQEVRLLSRSTRSSAAEGADGVHGLSRSHRAHEGHVNPRAAALRELSRSR